ncbi:MAG: transketolase, partial [Planctomycetes bacterium]|nr:transketolase [Planctomycetota bacterium]
LYFRVMRLGDRTNPHADRDRFILSKGHAAPVIYAALAELGYFPKNWLPTLRRLGSKLQGHPDMKKTPGVDMTAGSLGNGLSAGVGMALYAKIRNWNSQIYVMLGDGEIQEGLVWEAALSAPNQKLDNLIAIIDYNHLQSCGSTDAISQLEPLVDKWRSFGWHTFEINGHDMADIVNRLEIAAQYQGRPIAIVAHTVKGKGISFMENDNAWHQKTPTQEQYEQAMRELEVTL